MWMYCMKAKSKQMCLNNMPLVALQEGHINAQVSWKLVRFYNST